jgi:hypothetical protein
MRSNVLMTLIWSSIFQYRRKPFRKNWIRFVNLSKQRETIKRRNIYMQIVFFQINIFCKKEKNRCLYGLPTANDKIHGCVSCIVPKMLKSTFGSLGHDRNTTSASVLLVASPAALERIRIINQPHSFQELLPYSFLKPFICWGRIYDEQTA